MASRVRRKTAKRPSRTAGRKSPAKRVRLLSGGNPQIAKAEGDAPVKAYLAAMPGWKRDVGRRLDAMISRAVPGVRKAVKWNSPFYGLEGKGWFLSFHAFTRYVKVAFFRGAALRPPPPGPSKSKDARYLDIHEDDAIDEAQLAKWIRQAAALPGWMALLAVVSLLSVAAPARAGWVTLPNAPAAPIDHGRHEDVFFVSPDSGWVVNGAGDIHRTTDGGQSWTLQTTVYPNFLRSVGFATPLKGWAGSLYGSPLLYATNDAGVTWTPVTNIPDPQPTGICGLSVVNELVAYGCGRYDGPPAILIKTTDGGATWTSQDMEPYATCLIDVHFFDANNGLAVGGTGSPNFRKAVILSTSDGGATWQTRYNANRPGAEWCWKISFPDRLTGFVSIEREDNKAPRYVLATANGGLTWTEIPFVAGYDEQGIGFVSAMTGWVGGWTGNTYETLDGGASWHLAGFGVFLNRVRVLGSSLAYGVGQTVYKYTGDATAVGDDGPASIALAQNRPNPVTASTFIGFRLEAPERVRLTIHDVQGRTVRTLCDELRSAGANDVGWDARDHAGRRVDAGVYWYRLETPTRTEARTLVVVH